MFSHLAGGFLIFGGCVNFYVDLLLPIFCQFLSFNRLKLNYRKKICLFLVGWNLHYYKSITRVLRIKQGISSPIGAKIKYSAFLVIVFWL